MSVGTWLAAFALGGVGAVARFLVDGAVTARTAAGFPYGTLVVNLSGSLALGAVTGLALGHEATLLVGTATIGAYTTFSTWLLETERLGEDAAGLSLAANVAVSIALGVGAAAVGRVIGSHL